MEDTPADFVRALYTLDKSAAAEYENAATPAEREVWARISTAINSAWHASCAAIASDPTLP